MLDPTTPKALALIVLAFAIGPLGAAAAEPTVPHAVESSLCPFVNLGTIPPEIVWACLPCVVNCAPDTAAVPARARPVPQP